MEKSWKTHKNIIFWIIAALFFAIIFAVFAKKELSANGSETPEIVIMGDSLIANAADGELISGPLSGETGMSVADMSFGGTCLSYLDVDGRLDNSDDAFCMAALAQAIAAKDFRYQLNARTNSNAQWYFADRVAELSEIDFSKVRILIIEQMLNDYQSGVAIEAGTDIYNEYSYEGALRSIITELKKSYPDLRIILMTPTETWYDGISSHEKDFGGGTIDDYVAAEKKVASELGVEQINIIDLYLEDAGSSEKLSWLDYTLEGVHPQQHSFGLISKAISDYLKGANN